MPGQGAVIINGYQRQWNQGGGGAKFDCKQIEGGG